VLTRTIPKTGEAIPAVGMGTWLTFDLGETATAADRASRAEVLRRLFGGGGRVIDTSPMYGAAEAVVGELLAQGHPPARPFLADKVWTSGQAAGVEQMEESLRRLRVERIDLMQVHNLLDWRTHLPTLRAWKEQGRIRYIGVTHYQLAAFAELEQILRTEEIDFLQVPYSLAVREAAERLLPTAAERGVAVLAMRPLQKGVLPREAHRRPLPDWAGEIDCTSWPQLFLKFVLAHPAVTCAIPATHNPEHVADNMRAGLGRLPDQRLQRKMIELLEQAA
jgi:diketogulonate reductase-like aldo/keto reductase